MGNVSGERKGCGGHVKGLAFTCEWWWQRWKCSEGWWGPTSALMGSPRLLCGAHLGTHRYKADQLEMMHHNSAERTHGSLTGMERWLWWQKAWMLLYLVITLTGCTGMLLISHEREWHVDKDARVFYLEKFYVRNCYFLGWWSMKATFQIKELRFTIT